MIRAINTRSDGSLFLNDVAQWEGKPPPTLGLVKIVMPRALLRKLFLSNVYGEI
jgi:hypothetical protein